jgi:hypothetical protein
MMRERWLFTAVLALFAGGVAAAIWVADSGLTPGYALDSNLVYRVEIGAVLVGFAYAILVTLRLAWRGETFTKFSVGPAGAEAGDNFDSAAEDLDVLRADVETLTTEMSTALVALAERLERVEGAQRG